MNWTLLVTYVLFFLNKTDSQSWTRKTIAALKMGQRKYKRFWMDVTVCPDSLYKYVI